MEEKKDKRRSAGMSPLDDPNEKYFFMETRYGGLARVPESKMGAWLEQQEKIKRGEVKPDDNLTRMFLESAGYSPSEVEKAMTGEKSEEALWLEDWYRQKEEEYRQREEVRMKRSGEERQPSEE